MNKRNVLWSTGGAMVFCLLGLAVFYLVTRVQQNRQVGLALSRTTSKLAQLARRDPYPNAENIKAAQEEEARLQRFLTRSRRTLPQRLALRCGTTWNFALTWTIRSPVCGRRQPGPAWKSRPITGSPLPPRKAP